MWISHLQYCVYVVCNNACMDVSPIYLLISTPVAGIYMAAMSAPKPTVSGSKAFAVITSQIQWLQMNHSMHIFSILQKPDIVVDCACNLTLCNGQCHHAVIVGAIIPVPSHVTRCLRLDWGSDTRCWWSVVDSVVFTTKWGVVGWSDVGCGGDMSPCTLK